jgi:hypothetical protein
MKMNIEEIGCDVNKTHLRSFPVVSFGINGVVFCY